MLTDSRHAIGAISKIITNYLDIEYMQSMFSFSKIRVTFKLHIHTQGGNSPGKPGIVREFEIT